jgi:hypothetical protein
MALNRFNLFVISAQCLNVKVKRFKQARVNGGSNYDLKEGHKSEIEHLASENFTPSLVA